MISSIYEIGDVLRVEYKGAEVLARVSGYVDSLDKTKPLYVNFRVPSDTRWSTREVKVNPEQVRGEEKEWAARLQQNHEVGIKETVDRVWAKMTPYEKSQAHKLAVELRLME